MIAAVAANGVIGSNNAMPWHLPADVKYFKGKTVNKTVVIGLKTLQSIGNKPLPDRKHIILSDDPSYKIPEGCLVARSMSEVLEMIKSDDEVMVCGGASIYSQFLPIADKLYLTFIHQSFEGDAFFPEFNKNDWREVERKDFEADAENKYPYSFMVFERKN